MTGEQVTPEMMRSGAYKKTLEPISAGMLFSTDSPPTLSAWGELDRVAPYAVSKKFAQKLQSSSVPHDVLVFPNSGHALNRDPDMNELLGTKINDYLDRHAPLG